MHSNTLHFYMNILNMRISQILLEKQKRIHEKKNKSTTFVRKTRQSGNEMNEKKKQSR